MKDKIGRLSKGDFEYELPFLCLSEENIHFSVVTGKTYEGSLSIKNSAGRKMKGILYSSSRLLTFTADSFSGIENVINYRFDAAFLKQGDSIKGEIIVVSDCGEYKLPFFAEVEAPYCDTSIGKIRDLFQFANLAKMDWTEAKKVFRSEDFEQIFLKNDGKYITIYRNLLKNISTSQALEEFLIAIHKKSKITLSIDKTNLDYKVSDGEFLDNLTLTKDHWGYAEIKVSTDAPFIQLEQKFVWADRFIGNTHQISYVINPAKMRQGNNYGRIWIKTVYQTITVDVVCRYHKNSENTAVLNLQDRHMDYRFAKNYLNFRIGRINLAQYLAYTEALLKGMKETGDGYLIKLMNIHLAILSNKSKEAGQLLGECTKEESMLKKKSAVEYCAYHYLEALYQKNDETINRATDMIRRYYLGENPDWRILWFLLYTDKRYETNLEGKLRDIREQFDAGCHSPILYYEAALIYNEEPYLLRDLNEFEIQVLNFSIKNAVISKDTAFQFNYLAGKKKYFNPVIFKCLTQLYKNYGSTDILASICSMLIKGLKKSGKYFEWYRLGVEAQLRITELYEYYIYSADEGMDTPVAQPVLLYFIYSSSLNDKKRAFLYANVIKNKDKIESIYRSYYKKIEIFALKQLEIHNISPDLAVIYREFMKNSTIKAEMAGNLPGVVFTRKLYCDNPNMVGVVVLHKELDDEESRPLTDGIAYIQLYSQNTEIFLADSFGNRYTVSVDYSLQPMFEPGDYENLVQDISENTMMQLHQFERCQSNRIMSEKSVEVRKQVLLMKGLNDEYYMDSLLSLIDFYYENYNDELLEQYLQMLDLNKINQTVRVKYIEYLIIRGFYDKAMEAFRACSFDTITINRLVKLCSGCINNTATDNKKDILTQMCYYIFAHGKYDEAILKYLVGSYYGPTDKMFILWQAAKDFELETHPLEERLLVQMLFAEGYIQDSFKVFHEYYKNMTNPLLVRAFLTYYAYKYLVHDRVISSELFPIMRRELNYEENDICLLAWIKYNSENHTLAQNELDYISLSIHKFEKKGIVLPFFMDYGSKIKLPERISDKYYIEYKTNPKNQVYIHYRLIKNDTDGDFITEKIPNVLLGIHIKEFVLFYHEVLQYYITEEANGEVSITESFNISYDREVSDTEESKYNQINLMLMAKEMQDDKTLLEMMEHYVKSEYIIEKCFKPVR